MNEIPNLQISSNIELVRRYGRGLSHATLDPSCNNFRVPHIDGLIGFRVIRQCAVVYGDPLCAPGQKSGLADAFSAHCAANGWFVLYVAATGTMQTYAREHGYGTVEFADSLMANSQHDPEEGPEGRHLRQNLNRTRRLGVTIREYAGTEPPDGRLEAQAEIACAIWRESRHGPQIYLGNPRLFADRQGRRWFMAERCGSVVGVLSMLDVSCGDCCRMINLVFCTPAAPPHTNDLMVAAALKRLREDGIRSVCFGIGPRLALGRVEGFGGISEFLARRIYRVAARTMPLHSKTDFWEKYAVISREPLYLLVRPPRIGFRVLVALAKTFHFSVT